MKETHFDVAIVGAGIVGLAHAYHLAKAGRRVAVFERHEQAVGASIRNFGMVWPIGQPPGEARQVALRSREIWLEALRAAGIWHRASGSLHLAYADDELGVLEEFVEKGRAHGYECEVVSPTRISELCPAVKQKSLKGALYSGSEICVFPRQVVWELPAYLRTLGTQFFFGHQVVAADTGGLTAGGKDFTADQIILCNGDDFETLFPVAFQSLGLIRSKLQMLRARPTFDVGIHLCAGLTLGHYANFRICERLADLEARYKKELPDHVKWGIHLLVSCHEDGQLTIGDSHEYGNVVTPFLREEIDALILEYLDTFLPVEQMTITERWHGVYAKHPTKSFLIEPIRPGITATTGVGGAGMTMSFGVAEHALRQLSLL